jgi:hypothetical protein
MSNALYFTQDKQDGCRFYWAQDKYDLLYVIQVSHKGLLGAVLDDGELNPLYTVSWEGTKVHVDEMKKKLQQIANQEHESRLLDIAIQVAEMEVA